MKKILIILTILLSSLFSSFLTSNTFAADDDLDTKLEQPINDLLWEYTPDKPVKWDAAVETGLKTLINKIVDNLSYVLWILAIWAIVYWGIILVTSAWEDEKVTKWKNIIKWALIWFAWLVSAAWLIKIVISVIYWLSNV